MMSHATGTVARGVGQCPQHTKSRPLAANQCTARQMPRMQIRQDRSDVAFAAQHVRCSRLAATGVTVTTTAEAASDAEVTAVPAAAVSAVPGARVQDVSVTEERKPRSHTLLTVTISPRLGLAQFNKEMAYFQKNTQVPGFRMGGKKGNKIPSSLLLDTLGGKDKIKRSTVEQLLKRTLPLAFQPYKAQALESSLKIESEIDTLVQSWNEGQPLVFQVGFDTLPEVSWKSSYRDLKVDVPSLGDESTDEVEIDAKLLSMRKETGTMRVVIGRGLQRGDCVICDFNAERADVGEAIIGARREGMQVDTDTADKVFLPGMVENMAGMVAGDTREFVVIIPQTWETESLRGVPARCTVTVNEVFEWELPEFSNQYAEDKFPGCGGAEGLRREILKVQTADRMEDQSILIQDMLTEAVRNVAICEVPETLVREMGEGEYQTTLIKLQQESGLSMQQLEQLATEEMLDNYIVNKYSELEDMQRTVLAFDAIFEQEGLSVSEEAVQDEFKTASEEFQREEQDYDEERLLEQVRETLKATEVLELLRKTCDVTIVPKTA